MTARPPVLLLAVVALAAAGPSGDWHPALFGAVVLGGLGLGLVALVSPPTRWALGV